MSTTRLQPQKKGLHPLAWIAIGCGGIAVIGGIVVVAVSIFVVNKAGDLAREMEDNPAPTLAKVLAAANPEIEFVADDPDSGTITFLNTSTNEEIVVSYGDIEEGRISFSDGDDTASFELDSDDDGQSRMVVTTNEGTTTFETGTSVEDLPHWVPVYSGTSPEGTLSTNTPDGRGGGYSAKTDAPLSDVARFYLEALEGEGFQISNRTTSGDAAMISAMSENPKRQATVILGSRSGETEIVVQYSESN